MNNIDNLSIFCNKFNIKDPRTNNFEEIELDSKIEYFVKTINKSNWLYTTMSCQGHFHENGYTMPYFSFIVDKDKLKEFLYMISETLPLTSDLFELTYYFQISNGPSDSHYAFLSVYWCKNCIDNDEFYNNLNNMAHTINTYNKVNNNTDIEHLQKQKSIMQKLQEAYKDNPHRKYQYSVEERFIDDMINNFQKDKISPE